MTNPTNPFVIRRHRGDSHYKYAVYDAATGEQICTGHTPSDALRAMADRSEAGNWAPGIHAAEQGPPPALEQMKSEWETLAEEEDSGDRLRAAYLRAALDIDRLLNS